MDILLLAIYSFFVWLIFFKFKWLPWNTTSQVIVITIPVVALTMLILTLNVVAPSSHDVRVIKYVVNVSSDQRGRVLEVAEANKPMRKGDVLYRIDPTPYQLQVATLEAQLANTVGSSKELEEQLSGSLAQVAQSKSAIDQANARVMQASSDLELATRRVAQNRELVAKGAGVVAKAMRAIAARHGIPVVASPTLARALHAEMRPDQAVPTAHYAAVAKIMIWVINARRARGGATASTATGQGARA